MTDIAALGIYNVRPLFNMIVIDINTPSRIQMNNTKSPYTLQCIGVLFNWGKNNSRMYNNIINSGIIIVIIMYNNYPSTLTLGFRWYYIILICFYINVQLTSFE